MIRSLDLSFGHMAYSGYFGYFIGLAVLKPESRWKILLIGLVSASIPHALWDSVLSLDIPPLTCVGGSALLCCAGGSDPEGERDFAEPFCVAAERYLRARSMPLLRRRPLLPMPRRWQRLPRLRLRFTLLWACQHRR